MSFAGGGIGARYFVTSRLTTLPGRTSRPGGSDWPVTTVRSANSRDGAGAVELTVTRIATPASVAAAFAASTDLSRKFGTATIFGCGRGNTTATALPGGT